MAAGRVRNAGSSQFSRLLAAAVAGTSTLALAACGSSGGGAGSGGGDYVIGVQIDQSGISRSVGVPQLNGTKAAIDGINRRGGINGHKIKLITRDDGSDAARAVSVYRELTGQYHVSAIAGYIGSVSIPPVAPLAAKDKTALLVTGAPATLLDPPSPAVFSTIANLNAQGRAGLDYVKRNAGTGTLPANPRVALLYYASPAGEAWVKDVKAYAGKIGLNIVAAENSTVGAATLSSQMQAITSAKPDAIVAFDIEADITNAVKAGKAAGLPQKTTIVDYSFASSPSALKAVSGQGYTSYGASANYDVPGGTDESAAVKQFQADAKADGFDANTVMLAEGYAQGLIIGDVLKRCGSSCPAAKFLQTLEQTNSTLNGFAFGPVTYTSGNHQGVTAVRFRQWNGSSSSFGYAGGPIKLVFS
jgi:branched-chain amino acid transport system substrate-binding protein